MARLYADENFAFQVIRELRRLGHDVLTAREANNANRGVPDVEVLAFATSADRAVLTHDRQDFLRLHKSGLPHAGIIACKFGSDFAGQARRVHEAMEIEGNLAGRLVRVNRPAAK